MSSDGVNQDPVVPEDDGPVPRPTHRLKDILAGDNSVQLLVSTKDYIYDAEHVVAGVDSFQVIGTWDESALAELSKCLGARQQTARQGSSRNTAFGTKYGGGKKLGEL